MATTELDVPARLPTALSELRNQARAMEVRVQEEIRGAEANGCTNGKIRLFGEGLPTILERLELLERATQWRVRNLQRQPLFDPLRRERDLNNRSRSRRLAGHLITARTPYLPIVAACHPGTWVGPVEAVGLAVDDRAVLFPGPLSARGLTTAWLCTDPEIVGEFCEIWDRTQRHSVPIHDVPGLVRLTERQIDIAALLSRGTKDTTVARILGISLRTVTADVGKLMDALGVSSRWEAGMIIGQACPPSLVR